MQEINVSQVKETILAAKNLSVARELRTTEILPPEDTLEDALLSANFRDTERLLGDTISKLQIDLDRFERIHTRHQIDLNRLHEAQRAAAIKNSPRIAGDFANRIEDRRTAIDTLQAAKFKPVVENIDSPFLIWATPANILTDSHIEPYNSRAKFFFTSTAKSGVREVSFYYLWQNPSNRIAVINIDGFLAFNGFCQVGQSGGFFPGDRRTSLSLRTNMIILEWWNQPPTSPLSQASQTDTVLSFSASGGGGFGDVGAIESRSISRASGLGYNLFLIPPHGVIVIEYRLVASFGSGKNGSHNVLVDFDSGDFRVLSPFVVIQILT
jgi:hypothetical protein